MSIEVLSSDVVDQIAAGEVVERPAHLLKELLENALDAGSTKLEIRVANGGRHIEVKDNGSGMSPEDLQLCTQRHATSKIRSSADIFRLSSFGFRGEALASAAAISNMQILSRQEAQELASRIDIEFGHRGKVAEVGGSAGTQVVVEKLFDNVPARKKFLKSDSAEISQMRQVVKAIALVNPSVEFRFLVEGKMEFFWQKQSAQERCSAILGKELYYSEAEESGVKVKAYFSAPNDVARSSRSIWFFAQNRWIQDRSLQAAVMEGYRSFLMHGEYPFAVIQLEVDPEDIDVNIHPTKSQVKFFDSRSVFRAVRNAIREELQKAPWLEALTQAPAQDPAAEMTVSEEENSSALTPTPRKSVEEKSSPAPVQDYQQQKFSAGELNQTQYQKKPTVMEQLKNYAPQKSTPAVPDRPIAPDPFFDARKFREEQQWGRLQVLGQAHLTYLITQSDRALVYIDQHAAHERVLYEKISRHYEAGNFEVQKFLIPLGIDLEEQECEALLAQSEKLEKFGLTLERMSPSHITVEQAPVLLKESAIVEVLSKLARQICEQGDSFAIESLLTDIFATMACHSAIRAGQALNMQQMNELLEQMDENKSSFCPHGRPVYVEYPFDQLEKDFGRRV